MALTNATFTSSSKLCPPTMNIEVSTKGASEKSVEGEANVEGVRLTNKDQGVVGAGGRLLGSFAAVKEVVPDVKMLIQPLLQALPLSPDDEDPATCSSRGARNQRHLLLTDVLDQVSNRE